MEEKEQRAMSKLTKSNFERFAHERNKESNSKSDFKDRTVKMVEKRIKMHHLYIF